nr:hypothetical protein CFP56_53905 [Quercus suber]
MEGEGIMEKLTGEKRNSDFEEQLRELDAEIAGKADTGCNMGKVFKTRVLESEVKESAKQKEEKGGKVALGCNVEKLLQERGMVPEVKVSENKKEEKEGEDLMLGLGSGPSCCGPNGDLGRTEANYGPAELKNPRAQVLEPKVFQVGPKLPGRSGKDNVGVGTSELPKVNAMKEITHMEVEEVNAGPKRKSRVPLEEIMEIAEVGKRLKLEAEVVAFEAILSIPISESVAKDRMVWAEDKKGNFIVRSAYKLARDIEAEGSNIGCSDPSTINEVWHGGKRRPGPVIVRCSLKLLEDFQSANERPCKPRIEDQPSVAWKPPPLGSFKVNINGALFSKTKQSGVGVMVCDEKGNVIAAMSRKLDLPLGALETKAKALEIGVKFAEEVGLRDVVFEGNSQLIINAVQGIGEAAASVQNIIHGVLQKA